MARTSHDPDCPWNDAADACFRGGLAFFVGIFLLYLAQDGEGWFEPVFRRFGADILGRVLDISFWAALTTELLAGFALVVYPIVLASQHVRLCRRRQEPAEGRAGQAAHRDPTTAPMARTKRVLAPVAPQSSRSRGVRTGGLAARAALGGAAAVAVVLLRSRRSSR